MKVGLKQANRFGWVMSKKDFTNFIDGLTDEQMMEMIGVGATLRDFGKHLEEAFDKRFGVKLDTDQRKENDGKPQLVANPVIDIDIPGIASFVLRPTDTNNKGRGYGYAKDFGLSDKVKTGNVPPTLLGEILVDKIATMLGGNIKDKPLTALREALRACMTIEDGKFSFDKKKAPPLTHPVEVAEFMLSLKQEFVGTAAGASHVSMEVIPVPIDPDSSIVASVGEPNVPSASHPVDQEAESHDIGQVEEESPDTPSGTTFIEQQAILFGDGV